MRRKLFIIMGALLAAAAISAGSIVAYEHFRSDHRSWRETGFTVERQGMSDGVRDGSLIPLARALDIAAARLPGEVLKIELERKHGRPIYEIKVLADNGRVREIELDGRSGDVLEIEED
jgi:uncharacterized membrane protein YkoI